MTREERLDERQEQEALKSAKEIAKKKSKNKIRKIIWHAVKVAIIPFLLLFAKIMAVVILVCVVVSMFQGILDDGDDSSTSTDEEYNSTVTTQQGGIDITSDTWQTTTMEIEIFINTYNSTNTELKEEMLNRVSEIEIWQNTYGYSALFLVTVAFEEGITAEGFNEFLNTMNRKAATWQTSGYKTTQEIAKDYVGDDTYIEWSNNIENKMQEGASNLGIIAYGEKNISGDGYDNAYVSKSGKLYRNYKQTKGSYSQARWCGTDTIYISGCPLICVTILASGYQNSEINPLQVVEGCATVGVGLNIGKALNKCGLSYTKPYERTTPQLSDQQKNNIKNFIASGKPAMIRVISPGSIFTDSQHWMALLDYNASTNEFYVSNPNHYGPTGWIDSDTVLTGCTEYIGITN